MIQGVGNSYRDAHLFVFRAVCCCWSSTRRAAHSRAPFPPSRGTTGTVGHRRFSLVRCSFSIVGSVCPAQHRKLWIPRSLMPRLGPESASDAWITPGLPTCLLSSSALGLQFSSQASPTLFTLCMKASRPRTTVSDAPSLYVSFRSASTTALRCPFFVAD